MQFPAPNSEEPAPVPRRQHDLAIEILRFATALLGFLLLVISSTSKYSWLSRPWVVDVFIVLGVLILTWLVKPRVAIVVRHK
jgi:hypothetical protein